MKKSALIMLAIAVLICLPFFIYSVICILPNMEWRGFGVDSGGQVYTGQSGKLLVHADRELVNEITIPKYRTYFFTVLNNDTILIADASDIDIYDLSGKLLDSYPDPGPDKYNQLQWTRTIHHPSGDIYRVRNFFGIRTITKNSETVVYRTPIIDFLLCMLAMLSFVAILVSTFVINIQINAAFQKNK